jgi:hypothetical protein
MRYSEFTNSEQVQEIAPVIGTIGSAVTRGLSAVGSAVGSAVKSAAGITGNVADLQNPAMQAASLAQQKKQTDDQKKAIQDQISALQKQLADLNRTP